MKTNVALALAAAGAAALAEAATLTVGRGEAVMVTADAVYETVVVHGDLTVSGACNSSLPFAQASKERPGGLYLGAKPSALSAMSGRPSSIAARAICFSPGLMQGETSTAPRAAASRRRACSAARASGEMRREHWI